MSAGWRRSFQGAAAVDLDGLSGDQGAGLGGEQQRRADRVLGGGEAAHGDVPQLVVVLGGLLEEIVDQLAQAGFAGGVGGEARVGDLVT